MSTHAPARHWSLWTAFGLIAAVIAVGLVLVVVAVIRVTDDVGVCRDRAPAAMAAVIDDLRAAAGSVTTSAHDEISCAETSAGHALEERWAMPASEGRLVMNDLVEVLVADGWTQPPQIDDSDAESVVGERDGIEITLVLSVRESDGLLLSFSEQP